MGFFDRQHHGLMFDKGAAVINVRHTSLGAVGDGSTDDRAAFATRDQASRQFVVPSTTSTGTRTYSIQSNLTLAGDYHIFPGAQIQVTGTTVLTFNGEVTAGRYQVFATTGTVTLTQVRREAEWFGATSPVLTATSGDETPSVAKTRIVKTSNTTGTAALRDLDDGVEGMTVGVVFGDSNTQVKFATATGLVGNAGVNWDTVTDDHMTCWRIGEKWHCDISDNTT